MALTTAGMPVRCETSPVNCALAVDRDRLRLVAGVVDDLDLAGLDDEELEVAVADREQRLPVPVQPGRGIGATSQLLDLGLIEGRECDRKKIALVHKNFSGDKGLIPSYPFAMCATVKEQTFGNLATIRGGPHLTTYPEHPEGGNMPLPSDEKLIQLGNEYSRADRCDFRSASRLSPNSCQGHSADGHVQSVSRSRVPDASAAHFPQVHSGDRAVLRLHRASHDSR